MAAVWRRTCGVTRFFANEGHSLAAASACFATMHSMASRLRRRPRAVENTGSWSPPGALFSQAARAAAASRRRGVHRSLRPFPWQRRWAPGPVDTSCRRSSISSETRRPVWTATRRSTRSRRPAHVVLEGASSRASTSARLRKATGRCSCRLSGIERMRSQ